VLLQAMKVLKGQEPREAFETAVNELCPESVSKFILKVHEDFLTTDLDHLEAERKLALKTVLQTMEGKVAHEISSWLEGKYVVGSECLTD
jgi:hypothetical protein